MDREISELEILKFILPLGLEITWREYGGKNPPQSFPLAGAGQVINLPYIEKPNLIVCQ